MNGGGSGQSQGVVGSWLVVFILQFVISTVMTVQDGLCVSLSVFLGHWD